MTIEGTIVQVLPIEQGVGKQSGNPWSKGTVIIETMGQYPKKVALSNMKRAEELIALPIGSAYKFDIDVESREFNGRWYTSVSTFRWEPLGGATQPMPQQAPQFAQSPQPYQTQAPSYQAPTQPMYQQPPQDDSFPF